VFVTLYTPTACFLDVLDAVKRAAHRCSMNLKLDPEHRPTKTITDRLLEGKLTRGFAQFSLAELTADPCPQVESFRWSYLEISERNSQ